MELSDITHPVKNDQVVLKKSIIDGADEVENSWYTDAVCRNGLSFLKVSIIWWMLFLDGADFYAKCKGWKSVKRKSLAEIAQSHWESIMIKILAGEKRLQLRILIWYTPLAEVNQAI